MSQGEKTSGYGGRRRPAAVARSLIGGVASLAVVAVAAGLAVAWLWPDDGGATNDVWAGRARLLAFYARVFQLHLGLAALAATSLVFLARRWRAGLACAVASAATLMPYAREYVPKSPPPAATRTLRVMSLNLFVANHDAAKTLAAIERESPDVIVACEVTPLMRRSVFAKLAAGYPHAAHPDHDTAAIVMSRVPFAIDRPTPGEPPRKRTPLIFAIDGRAFAMYPVHLTSPGGRANLMRNRAQTRMLAAIVTAETRPTMIVGDCNFTPLTPNYRSLESAGLRSTHHLAGVGVGHTWGPKWHPRLNLMPGVRIDQMLISRELTATHHHVGADTGSDHRPIVADVAFTDAR